MVLRTPQKKKKKKKRNEKKKNACVLCFFFFKYVIYSLLTYELEVVKAHALVEVGSVKALLQVQHMQLPFLVVHVEGVGGAPPKVNNRHVPTVVNADVTRVQIAVDNVDFSERC